MLVSHQKFILHNNPGAQVLGIVRHCCGVPVPSFVHKDMRRKHPLNYFCLKFHIQWGVVAEPLRAPNSSSADSVQQSVSSNPGRDTCVPEQDT